MYYGNILRLASDLTQLLSKVFLLKLILVAVTCFRFVRSDFGTLARVPINVCSGGPSFRSQLLLLWACGRVCTWRAFLLPRKWCELSSEFLRWLPNIALEKIFLALGLFISKGFCGKFCPEAKFIQMNHSVKKLFFSFICNIITPWSMSVNVCVEMILCSCVI